MSTATQPVVIVYGHLYIARSTLTYFKQAENGLTTGSTMAVTPYAADRDKIDGKFHEGNSILLGELKAQIFASEKGSTAKNDENVQLRHDIEAIKKKLEAKDEEMKLVLSEHAASDIIKNQLTLLQDKLKEEEKGWMMALNHKVCSTRI
uniref:Uncharacterized protein n=1 Tax=Spongospora subterranea TaxID=70186 RepID=A0A0H5RSF3_9EUKA|eukprot:CRZ11669.1 hypothetical protein [Spongospora subterranea]